MQRKGIFTLIFERGCEDDPLVAKKVWTKLEDARRSRGVVVAPPECVKSLLLKFIELLHGLELSARARGGGGVGGGGGVSGAGTEDLDDMPPMALPTLAREASMSRREGVGLSLAGGFSGGSPGASGGRRRRREEREELELATKRSAMAQELAKVIRLWHGAVLIMDEVDMLLHPLRSELNFPIGDKTAIDLHGARWELPMHLVELVFVQERAARNDQAYGTDHEWAAAEALLGYNRSEVLSRMETALERGGPPLFALQGSPHLVLLDTGFYA